MTTLVRIPKVFYDDHVGRELPAPKILRVLARQYEIDADSSEAQELLEDAEHYSDVTTWGNGIEYGGIERSARATARIIRSV